MAILIYEDNSGNKNKYEIKKDKITIGRNKENDLIIPDAFVSRKHAVLEEKNGSYTIKDLNSSYGILVNNEKVEEYQLKHGDVVQLGSSSLTYIEEESSEHADIDLLGDTEQDSLQEQFNQIKSIKKELNSLKLDMNSSDTIQTNQLLEFIVKTEETISSINEKIDTLEKAHKITATLYEVGKIINSVFELDKLLNLVMDLALKVMDAERGFIMLVDEKTGDLETKAARNMGSDIDEGARSISYGIASRVLEEKEPIMTADASSDPRFSRQVSVIMYKIRSVMCVPLKNKDQDVIGIIYVDNRISKGYFSEDDLDFLVAFANHASIAIENAKLYENIRTEEKLRLNLQRYLPINVVDQMLYGESFQLGGRHVKVTILFSDIKSFTTLSENLEPEETVSILNEFFSVMTEEVFVNGGTLDKYVGDGLMALFGAPISHENDSLLACKTALGMMEKLDALNRKWEREQKDWNLEMKIGINTGEVVAGNVGSEKRMDYTVIGDAVNVSSRLESIADGGEILISDDTYKEIEEYAEVEKLERREIKGKSTTIQVYRLLGLKNINSELIDIQ